MNIDLSTLDGTNGFRINGVDAYDRSGTSVSAAGDVNGDGFDDVIIGASVADGNGELSSGESYVVFGSNAGFSSSFDLSALDGTNGFRIDGIDAGDQSGYSVSAAGDVDGDGIGDVIVGARYAYVAGIGSGENVGESYIIFGSDQGFASSLDLSTLDGANGFRIVGADSLDVSGYAAAAAGDVNGDGLGDVIIGAPGGDAGALNSGESYVVFGSNNGFASSINLSLLDGTNGFRIDGIDIVDVNGNSVSGAGDINGDGIDDIIIAARNAGQTNNGESYVVFGSDASFSASLDLSELDGSDGFRITGFDTFNVNGLTVSEAGDVNGDGFDDVIIGVPNGDAGGALSGESYVLFGTPSFTAGLFDVASLDGTNGFRIDGVAPSDLSGLSVSGAGDVNGDGIDDLIIGAYGAELTAGESYVIFGSDTGFAASLDLSSLDGSNGFLISGIDVSDQSGFAVSGAGDVNGDGVDDLIIGAPLAAANGANRSGESYVVFGNAPPVISGLETASVPENQTFVLDIEASDNADSEGSGLAYALTGGADQALFELDQATGVLSFTAAPRLRGPGRRRWRQRLRGRGHRHRLWRPDGCAGPHRLGDKCE